MPTSAISPPFPGARKHLDGPDMVVQTPQSRFPRATGEHELFSRTLNSRDTIPAFVMAYRRPRDAGAQVRELKSFLTLDAGINGYPGVCHGGIVATILDEVMALIFYINQERGTGFNADYMTAYLNTTYLAPIRTPGTIMVVLGVAKDEDRKVFLEAHIEDENGTVLAKGDCLYVALRQKL